MADGTDPRRRQQNGPAGEQPRPASDTKARKPAAPSKRPTAQGARVDRSFGTYSGVKAAPTSSAGQAGSGLRRPRPSQNKGFPWLWVAAGVVVLLALSAAVYVLLPGQQVRSIGKVLRYQEYQDAQDRPKVTSTSNRLRELKEGLELFPGDRLESSLAGLAEAGHEAMAVELWGDVRLTLGADTKVRMTPQRDRRKVVEFSRGSISIHSGQSEVRVETDFAEVAVEKGGEPSVFQLKLDSDALQVTVKEGKVLIANTHGSTGLEAGQELSVSKGQAPQLQPSP